MNTEKLSEIFIGAGAAFDANNTAMASVAAQTAIIGSDMTALNPAGGDTISTQPYIYIVNKLANGDLKRSFPVNGTSVTSWKGQHYKPSRRQVWGIGYQRGSVVDGVTVAASGSITVSNSTDYSFSIRFKNDKTMFSVRPETLEVSFTSSATATQLSIAAQIANAINNSGFGSSVSGVKVVKAIIVADGTGVVAASGTTPAIQGGTGATNYGVEIVGLDVNQFQNTSYTENQVYFSVHVLDASGFESTPSLQIQSAWKGVGTYNQVYNMENKFFGNEGVLNRTKWPIPTLIYLSSSTYAASGNVAAAATLATGNISAGLINTDWFVVTATTGLRPGDLITINAVAYEIKYIASATVVVLTAVQAATYTGAALKVKYGYNVFTIETTDVTTLSGAGVGQFAKRAIYIASPAIDAAAADPFDRTLDAADTSAEVLDILDVLNAWMTSTPLAPAAITGTTLA